MRQFDLTIVIVICLLSAGLITAAYPAILGTAKLPAQGSIDYNGGHLPPGMTLLYSTDFEKVTVTDSHHISIPISHYFWYGPPSSPFWMEGYDEFNGITPHSGTRCLGLARVNIERSEIILREWPWDYSNTYFIRVWNYFPADWSTPQQSGGWELVFAFSDAAYPPGYPWIGVTLEWSGDPNKYILSASGSGFDNSYNGPYKSVRGFPVPKGQWSEWEYYIDRGTADVPNGSLKLWVDGVLWMDSGPILPAKASMNSGAYLDIYPSDLYGGTGGASYGNEQRWIDDLEIYGA